jgi:hypothetical protein
VSFDEVQEFMTRNRIDAGPFTSDFAFCAARMAEEYAELNHRKATIEDSRLALSWLCLIHLPGKPPSDAEVQHLVARLCRESKKKGKAPFMLPPNADSVSASLYTPRHLLVKVNDLMNLGIDMSGIPTTEIILDEVRTKVAEFERVIARLRSNL